MAVRQPHSFRKYKSRETPSWTPVIAVFLLAAFDVGIISWIVWQLCK